MSVRMLFHRYMGAAANNGYALFFEPGTSTAKTTYTSDYTTADSLNAAGGVEITSDGWLTTYLLGDYDMTVYTRTGVQIPSASALGINPQDPSAAESGPFNLLANGSFETDTDGNSVPDGWTLTGYSGGTNEMDSSDKSHASYSMSFTSIGNGGGFIVSDEFMPCSPERPVNVSFHLKSTADVRNLVEVIWYTAGGTEISDTDIYDNSTTNPTGWEIRSKTVTPPATAYQMKIRIYGCHSSDATAGTARFDNVIVATDIESGSYTATATGLTTTPTVTVYWRKIRNILTLHTVASISGTSNASSFTLTGAPASIWPNIGTLTSKAVVQITDNGTNEAGTVVLSNSGVLTFARINGAGFTTSSTKAALIFSGMFVLDLP